VGDPLHLLRGQTRAVEHHGNRVAGVRRGGENVDLIELAQHGTECARPARGVVGTHARRDSRVRVGATYGDPRSAGRCASAPAVSAEAGSTLAVACAPVAQDAIDDPVGNGVSRRHEVVAFHVAVDALAVLGGVVGKDFLEALA